MPVRHACPNRMDPVTTHVIPEEIEEIELIKGPFSVRYGPTMGAVLNIVTQRVKPSETFDWGGELASGYEFNGNGHSTRLLLQAADRHFLPACKFIRSPCQAQCVQVHAVGTEFGIRTVEEDQAESPGIATVIAGIEKVDVQNLLTGINVGIERGQIHDLNQLGVNGL